MWVSSVQCRHWSRHVAGKSKLYYRKRFRASYIVREVLSVRQERERERERERGTERETDGNDVTLVELKLAMCFALFFAKNCTLVSPLL